MVHHFLSPIPLALAWNLLRYLEDIVIPVYMSFVCYETRKTHQATMTAEPGRARDGWLHVAHLVCSIVHHLLPSRGQAKTEPYPPAEVVMLLIRSMGVCFHYLIPIVVRLHHDCVVNMVHQSCYFVVVVLDHQSGDGDVRRRGVAGRHPGASRHLRGQVQGRRPDHQDARGDVYISISTSVLSLS